MKTNIPVALPMPPYRFQKEESGGESVVCPQNSVAPKRGQYEGKRPANPLCLRGIRVAPVLAVFALAACATTPEPRIITQKVSVPVPVPCSVDAGPDPAPIWTPEAIAATPGLYQLGMLLYAALLQEQARNKELTAALAGCK